MARAPDLTPKRKFNEEVASSLRTASTHPVKATFGVSDAPEMVGGQERGQVPGTGDREAEVRDRFGQSSERSTVLEQLELQLSDLEADARTSRHRSADGSGAARSGAAQC